MTIGNRRCLIFGIAATALILWLSAAFSAVPEADGGGNGAETIVLDGGMLGQVPFAHRMHQNSAESCDVCHALFPQKPGAIHELQARQVLKKQQVMNGLCISCHREKQDAGQASGPTQCGKCHQR